MLTWRNIAVKRRAGIVGIYWTAGASGIATLKVPLRSPSSCAAQKSTDGMPRLSRHSCGRSSALSF
jgi:hypothetical protein